MALTTPDTISLYHPLAGGIEPGSDLNNSANKVETTVEILMKKNEELTQHLNSLKGEVATLNRKVESIVSSNEGSKISVPEEGKSLDSLEEQYISLSAKERRTRKFCVCCILFSMVGAFGACCVLVSR